MLWEKIMSNACTTCSDCPYYKYFRGRSIRYDRLGGLKSYTVTRSGAKQNNEDIKPKNQVRSF